MGFNSGAPDLGKNGCTPTLQFTDISGNARPGVDFAYSIGAEEMQYTILTNPNPVNPWPDSYITGGGSKGDTNVQSKYIWYFGDGETSTEINPYHIYKMPGEYEVMRVRTCPNGITDINYLTVYVYELERIVTYTNKCIRSAVTQQQGVGMVEWGGVNWLWPEAYVGTCNGYDIYNETISLVMDTYSGMHFRIGIPEQWLDRLMNLDYLRGGYEIPTWFRLPENTSKQGEFQDIEHNESYVYMKPFYKEDKNKDGYRDDGFRDEFQVGGVIYEGQKIVHSDDLKRVPLEADWVFRKKLKARQLQLEINTTTSSYRCTGVQERVVEHDAKPGPLLNTKTETTLRREFKTPDFWIARNSQNPLVNRATAFTVTGSYDYLSEGPDKYSKSAIVFGASDGLTIDLNTVTESTILQWVKSPVGNVSLWSFDGNQSIRLHYEKNEWVVDINNGHETLEVGLDWDGNSWILLTIKTSGDMVRVYKNKTDMGWHKFRFGSYGRNAAFMNNSQAEVYSIRRLPRTVSKDAIDDYYESVIEHRGNRGYEPVYK